MRRAFHIIVLYLGYSNSSYFEGNNFFFIVDRS
jgi:hypothetical protein